MNRPGTLDVDKRGRVTFPPEVFDYLGAKPGAKLKLTFLPNGECLLEALRPTGSRRGAVILRKSVPRAESRYE